MDEKDLRKQLEGLFSDLGEIQPEVGQEQLPQAETKPKARLRAKRPAAVSAGSQQATQLLLDKRIRELNCLNDVSHKLDENPPAPELMEWLALRIPPAMQHPEVCLVGIEFGGR